jgi:NMT1-like family
LGRAQAPRIIDLSVDELSSALCSGSIDAALLVVGPPIVKIKAMLNACQLNLVPVAGPSIDAFGAAEPYFTKGSIAGKPYGLTEDVPSFGVRAILMTTASMDSRVISDFAKSLATHIDTLESKHPVLEDLNRQAIAPERLPAPLPSSRRPSLYRTRTAEVAIRNSPSKRPAGLMSCALARKSMSSGSYPGPGKSLQVVTPRHGGGVAGHLP